MILSHVSLLHANENNIMHDIQAIKQIRITN
jgi:hypothetical protein